MNDFEKDKKTPLSKIGDANKLGEAILKVFTAEELNTATKNKAFSWSDDFTDFMAQGEKNPLSEIARKVRFIKTLASGQFVEDLEKAGGSEHIDINK